MDITSTLSNTVSKRMSDEETEQSFRFSGDLKQPENDAISNEQIRKGDVILKTYQVAGDAISGGMGSVWRVHHNVWDIDLAMKRPQPKFFAEGSRERKEVFIRECENWVHLRLHPNIVSCYYVREIGGIPTIFSEWMDGGSLKDCIRDGSLYEEGDEDDYDEDTVQERIMHIAIQTLRGLIYSHESGLVHQDIKPSNILLSGIEENEWTAKIADFGLASAKTGLDGGTDPAKTTGYTPAYCPEEQERGDVPEKWMDLYAWAVTVLEMFIGGRPWESGSEVKRDPDRYFSECRVELPPGMEDLIRDCIVQRADSAADIEKRLVRIYEDTTEYEYYKLTGGLTDTANILNNRALSFLDIGKPDEAEKLWKKALALNPRHKESIYNRTLFRFRKNEIGMDQIRDALIDINLVDDINDCYEQFVKESGGSLTLPDHEKRVPAELLGLHLMKENRQGTLEISDEARMICGSYRKDGSFRCIVYDAVQQKKLMDISDDSPNRDAEEESQDRYAWDRPFVSVDYLGNKAAVDIWEPAHSPQGAYHTYVFDLSRGKLIRRFNKSHGIIGWFSSLTVFEDEHGIEVADADSGRIVLVLPDCSLIRYLKNSLICYDRPSGMVIIKELSGSYRTKKSFPVDVCPEDVFVTPSEAYVFRVPYGYLFFDPSDGASCIRIPDDTKGFVGAFPTRDKRYMMLLYEEPQGTPPEVMIHIGILDTEEGCIAQFFRNFSRADASFYARLITGIQYKEYSIYLPGEMARYRLSSIQSSEERKHSQERFRECMDHVIRKMRSADFESALFWLDELKEDPDFASSPEPLRLRASICRYLKKKRVKRIVPYSEGFDFALVDWEEVEHKVDRLFPFAAAAGKARRQDRPDYDSIMDLFPGVIDRMKDMYPGGDLHFGMNSSADRLLVYCGRSFSVFDVTGSRAPCLVNSARRKEITFGSFLEDDRFLIFQHEDGYVEVYDIENDKYTGENFFGSLNGTVSLNDDESFFINRDGNRYLCWIEWEYDIENPPVMAMDLPFLMMKDYLISNKVLKKYYGSSGFVQIPSGITKIADNAFAGCESVRTVIIPEGVTEIGYNAFGNCISLGKVQLPDGLKTIGMCAFAGCVSLEDINLPDSLFNIKSSAFKECTHLKEIEIPDSVVVIESDAFQSCTSLRRALLPRKYAKMGGFIFKNCTSLEEIRLPSEIVHIYADLFNGCEKLKEIVIPESVRDIYNNAFRGCVNLKSLRIPDSVQEIRDGAIGFDRDGQQIKDFVLLGKAGGEAMAYAERNKLRFQEIP